MARMRAQFREDRLIAATIRRCPYDQTSRGTGRGERFVIEPGSQFAGFTIVELLGTGGMGEVYLARNPRLGRLDALKLLRPQFTTDSAGQARFLQEARVASALHHPNVVTIYDAGEADGRLYIDMQYVDGVDLRRVLEREGRLRAPRALAVLGQVAAALDAAHMMGMVHRDVKPENVLLSRPAGYPHEHAYLTDFGISKFVTDATPLTAAGDVIGTPAYLAPERLVGQGDHRADIYSLGCVLYECLTGSPPFVAYSVPALFHAHGSAPRPKVSEANPSLPQTLDPVLAQALATDPSRRFQSCGDLMAAAQRAFASQAGTVVVGAGLGSTTPEPDPAVRHRRGRLMAVLAALVVLAAAGGAGAIVLSGGSSKGSPSLVIHSSTPPVTHGASTSVPPTSPPTTGPTNSATSSSGPNPTTPVVFNQGELDLSPAFFADLDAKNFAVTGIVQASSDIQNIQGEGLEKVNGDFGVLDSRMTPGYAACLAFTAYTSQPIPVSDLSSGTYLCSRSHSGRHGLLKVLGSSGQTVKLQVTEWDDPQASS